MFSFVTCQNRTDLSMIDHYDFVILDIIQNFKKNNKNQLIKLSQLEANFWVKVERELAHQNQSAQLGERISKLYLEGFIVNKGTGKNFILYVTDLAKSEFGLFDAEITQIGGA